MAESLLTLRKKANELGIQNYAKYSKEELAKLIEQKEAGIETYTDPEYIASDEDVAKEKTVEEHAESVSKNAEEPRPEDEKKRKETKKAEKIVAKTVKKEKKQPKEKKEKQPRAPKTVLNVKPKSETKPEGMKDLSSQIYDELLKNDGRSFYQIAKALSTYYTVVKHVCDKHFDVVSE